MMGYKAIKAVFTAAIIVGALQFSFVPDSYAADNTSKKNTTKTAAKTPAKTTAKKTAAKKPEVKKIEAKKAEKPAAKKPSAGTGKYKSNGPIEITSDSLQVLQQEHQAIFTGHVLAVQGDVHLKSEKMTVFYKNNESKDGKEVSKNDKATPGDIVPEKNGIEKILVEKNVFLSTPEETASGAHGIYDVANQKIFLNDNVVLTRAKNVLKGDKLVYDFKTGKSELNAPDVNINTGSADKPRQRVKALFIPDDKNQEKK